MCGGLRSNPGCAPRRGRHADGVWVVETGAAAQGSTEPLSARSDLFQSVSLNTQLRGKLQTVSKRTPELDPVSDFVPQDPILEHNCLRSLLSLSSTKGHEKMAKYWT